MQSKSFFPHCALLLAAMLAGTISNGQQSARDPYATNGYRLKWADEFNVKGSPDAANWGYEQGFVRNNELQWYQAQNAWCANGMLVIEGRKEQRANPRYQQGSSDWRFKRDSIHYSAASLLTKGKKQWQYGRFVMRGRIKASAGLWPAWWTLGIKGQWPGNGEIDMMEYYRGRLLANIAMGTQQPYQAHWFSNTFSVDSLGRQWANQFHVWRMDWDEKAIALYVDDILLNKVPMDALANRDGSGVNPFKQPHYMLLNLAIGGDNGGDPSGTKFPARMEVDYVRVYQKD